MWFIGVEVEQETSAPPPKKNPGSAPELSPRFSSQIFFSLFRCQVKTIFITTFTGSGKSCLLGNWSLHHKEKFPKDAVVDHFAGCTSGSTGGKTFHSPLAHLP